MHNRALHDSLAAFVEEAAWQLAEEVSGGAEIPFELDATPTRSAPLYCYRPLTGRFLAQRAGMLAGCRPSPPAVHGLAGAARSDRLPAARGRRPGGPDPRQHADAALQAFLGAVWADVTDFVFDDERFEAAYHELEDDRVRGLRAERRDHACRGPRDRVRRGGARRRASASSARRRSSDVPTGVPEDPHATVAVLALETKHGDGRALEDAGRRLRRLQTALRLWDDAEPALGPTAWARTDGSTWMAIPLATGLRRPQGDCLLSAEEEDPLRAFCGLVARRTPRAGELAWALRRFELGCERGSAVEALTDWLLAARALFADTDRPGYEHVAERLAAICAEAHERPALEQRVREAISLERAAMVGFVKPSHGGRGARRPSSARACARCCATCSAATSTRRCASSPTSYSNRCERTRARPSTSCTSSASSGTTIVGGSPSASRSRFTFAASRAASARELGGRDRDALGQRRAEAGRDRLGQLVRRRLVDAVDDQPAERHRRPRAACGGRRSPPRPGRGAAR